MLAQELGDDADALDRELAANLDAAKEAFGQEFDALKEKFPRELEPLKKDHARALKALEGKFKEDMDALAEEAVDERAALEESFEKDLGALAKKYLKELDTYEEDLVLNLDVQKGRLIRKLTELRALNAGLANEHFGYGKVVQEEEEEEAPTPEETVEERARRGVKSRLARLQEFEIFLGAPTLENIETYEDALAEESIVAKLARPYVQWTTRFLLGQGNEKVVIGRDGWLFYRPSLLYPTGPSFRSHYVRADATVKDWDPLPAIKRFKEDLAARKIDLVMVPIPSKSQIYPEKLTRTYDQKRGPPVNSYTEEFYRELRKAGIRVIDLSRVLWDAKETGQVYMTLDTHWTPLGMKAFTDALAARLKEMYPWLQKPLREYRTESVKVTNKGDVFDMLDMPEWSEMYPHHPITVERVIDVETGHPAEPDEEAEVVFLGDSFTNVMSMKEMNWGDHAGLREHMMMRLGRPLDVIAVNGGAPSATRQTLARERSLDAKKLVVWSIVTREFITPDSEWKIVALPKVERSVAGAGPVELIGEVLIVSDPPKQGGEDPYPDAITYTLYKVREVLSGDYTEDQALVAEWVMLDFKLTDAAKYKVGDVHRLKLVPLRTKQKEHPKIKQAKMLDNTENYTLPPFWAEQVTPQK
jgi:alginate O-acetyltransferase complex protein AlgJ